MTRISLLIVFYIFSCCSSDRTGKQFEAFENSENKTEINQKATVDELIEDLNPESIDLEEFHEKELQFHFKDFKYLTLQEIAFEDLNGDGFNERIEFKKENDKSGLIIMDGKTGYETKIGFGNKFAHLRDFNWVDYWGILYDKETFETFFENNELIGDREVNLKHPAIILREEERHGGLIVFKEDKYIWIHQSD